MPEETSKERDQRIAKLWKDLDSSDEGSIDVRGLKKGLRKIGHPLRNADDLLHDVLKVVDTSGDGQIQFNEFRVFIEHAERELFQLFEAIDKDHSGSLDKFELRQAFSRSGIVVSNAKIDQFFDQIDTNHDGQISFEEWRCVQHSKSEEQADKKQRFSPFRPSRHTKSQEHPHILFRQCEC